jgi:hypothetical protein
VPETWADAIDVLYLAASTWRFARSTAAVGAASLRLSCTPFCQRGGYTEQARDHRGGTNYEENRDLRSGLIVERSPCSEHPP